MLEENKNVELKDEELAKVNGGGSGTIPDKGITYTNYASLNDGYYYSHEQNTNDVVYVYKNIKGDLYYTKEKFKFEGNNWWAINKTNGRLIENVPGFMIYYPYLLNIQP